jgi:hypothetical protein
MRLLAYFLIAFALPAQTVTINDTLYNATGAGPYIGTIHVGINSPTSANPMRSGGQTLFGSRQTLCIGVTASSCSTVTPAGVIRLTLYANSGIVPAGTSYSARYMPTAGDGYSETWVAATGNTTVAQMRSVTVPVPTVTMGLNQIDSGNATSGQVLAWNGAAWAPAAATSGYSATAVIDAAAVPDGACVLDSTAVTVTGAALGSKPSLGSSVQPPEGVTVTAKATGPNTMKLETCNHSGATYDAAPATYYFGAN